LNVADSPSKSIAIEELTQTSQPESIEQARVLLLEYGRFVIAQPGAARFCFGSLEKEAERLPFSYLDQGGGCLMARTTGKPAGFVAWREMPTDVAPLAWELKRLWIRPEARGMGMGRVLTDAVLNRARNANRQAIYLDTAPHAMEAAYRMYLAMGFVPCKKYNENPVEGLAYLVKHL
jgi:putative acetyltransferase